MPSTDGSNPTEGSTHPLAFLVPEQQQSAAPEAQEQQEERVEEQRETPQNEQEAASDDQSDASEEDAPKSEERTKEEQIQYERLSSKVKAGVALSKEQYKELVALEGRSVPYEAYTKQRQADRAQVKQYEAQVAELQARTKQLDDAIPILQALRETPEAVELLDAKLSGKQRQELDPTIAPIMQELQVVKNQLAAIQSSAGETALSNFESEHPDLLEDQYLRDVWTETALKFAQAGVEDPLGDAYELSVARVTRQRAPSESKVVQRLKEQAKENAVVAPSKAARTPDTTKAPSEADQILQGMLGQRRGPKAEAFTGRWF